MSRSCTLLASFLSLLVIAAVCLSNAGFGQEQPVEVQPARPETTPEERSFDRTVKPLLKKYCIRCHNVDKQTSGIRVDSLDGSLADRDLFLWRDIKEQLENLAMPPENEAQPSDLEREQLIQWIDNSMIVAKSRNTQKNGSVRRLTVTQYRNTLRDLLGIEDNLTDILPPDAVSKDGFVNNGQKMILSPLLLEASFTIAEEALNRSIVDPDSEPVIQNFRMELGKGINSNPLPQKLILGANSELLANADFRVMQLQPNKPFDYTPLAMRTKFRFHEGYNGNATVRGWRDYDSIYHAVFACMRGTRGYPKGRAYESVPEGLLLRPSIPTSEQWQQASTYGPYANFKISLRELPDQGRFRVKVKASRYPDGLLLDSASHTDQASIKKLDTVITTDTTSTTLKIPQQGIYQVSVSVKNLKKKSMLNLTLGSRHFSGVPALQNGKDEHTSTPFLLVRLPAGALKLEAKFAGPGEIDSVQLARVEADSEAAKRFLAFEKRSLYVGVHVGLRRDCGSTFASVGKPQTLTGTELKTLTFEGEISNYPSDDVQEPNDNYLAGVREIGVRSEYTDGRDRPRLLIHSVEFEGPFYETWPPKTHRQIFLKSQHEPNSVEYAEEIIENFATRAYRRPVTETESAALLKIWRDSLHETGDFQQSIKDALLVVLTSPQFLFLIEDSETPKPERLSEFELASKLSYFLWNTAPDDRLRTLAVQGRLHKSLDEEIDRMVADPRFSQFVSEFGSQWLTLDKLDVLEVDRQRSPQLTRLAREHLREEPLAFLEHLLRENLPVSHLIRSDLILANEVVANYYDLGERTESGFRFEPILHQSDQLGGVLTHAGILAGLSDGREANPVKRGSWLARKIIAEPPDDPPPNVPELPEGDNSNLSLREKLEKHRNQMGCAKCHEGIDPWGIPFQEFNAAGLFQKVPPAETVSTLPDETEVAHVNALKTYLAEERIDQVTFSVLTHLTTYAIGRTLTYNEIESLRASSVELQSKKTRMLDLLRFVIHSPMFLEK